jgi:transglutaminase-like putative cysteine protease
LHVASERPHYWRAEALDSFDGLRWLRTPAQQTAGASVELPAVRNPRWDETIRFRVRALRSDQLLSAGMPYEFHGAGAVSIGADGTAIVRGKRLSSGDAYAVDAYVPEPSAARMRAAPAGYEPYFWHYGDIHLPLPDDPSRREGRPDAAAAGLLYPPVRVELRGGNGSGIPGSEQALLASPYGAVYRLARRLTATAPTTYDAVRNVERHLRRNYRYDERPPQRPYPLRAFLFGDRAGYCQHFSGAMALMLRMAGIPARVAAGFAPGSLDSDSKEYRVRDLDAHSWVEVYFTGIGWVPFDPTPTVAPARSQGGGLDLASAALGDARDSGAAGREGAGDGARAPASERAGDPSPVASTPSGGRDVGTGLALLAGAAFLAVLVAVARGFRARRRAGARAGDPELADLDRLLRRARPPFAAAPTLLALERLLEGESEPRAARCIRRIRLRRFGPRAGPKPLKRERRALRRALRRRRGDGLAVALRFKGS